MDNIISTTSSNTFQLFEELPQITHLKNLQREIDQLDQLMRDNILSDDQQQHGEWYIQKCELEKALATIIRGL